MIEDVALLTAKVDELLKNCPHDSSNCDTSKDSTWKGTPIPHDVWTENESKVQFFRNMCPSQPYNPLRYCASEQPHDADPQNLPCDSEPRRMENYGMSNCGKATHESNAASISHVDSWEQQSFLFQ